MSNGYYMVIGEDGKFKNWVLNDDPFFMGGRGMFIKEWEPNFDPLKASIEEIPIWLKLYNLLRKYWDLDTLQKIGNKLGVFINADEAIEEKDFSMYARICIGWKPNSPLPNTLEIRTNVGLWIQKIEVEEFMEHCRVCKGKDTQKGNVWYKKKKCTESEELNKIVIACDLVLIVGVNILEEMSKDRGKTQILDGMESIADLNFNLDVITY
ncbi:uncharacterized protein LOC131866404 [Cryptomeria japonica]|uniref:uncharacterized protein LOC131866404 n=1 Tax=Cryptomeria japonica TaxID=3369 RepID=UPI0027DA0707|nr:uncharacterized protein LOC131866404 [Cryptomeria japonica]